MTIIPADAMSKPVRDFYADLTPEERAAEGLGPAPEKAAEPVAPAKETPAAKPEVEEPIDDDASPEDVLAEIAKLREDIGSALGKPEPEPEKPGGDALLEAALAHDDPVVRGLAERLQKAEEKVGHAEELLAADRVDRQIAKDDADFDAVQKNYTIDGKPMTDEHVEKVENYILKNPQVGRSLSIEEVTRVVFPTAARVGTKGTPPAPPPKGDTPGQTQPVATIVDSGTPGGAVREPWKPKPGDDVESSVRAAGRAFGWVR